MQRLEQRAGTYMAGFQEVYGLHGSSSVRIKYKLQQLVFAYSFQ